MASIALQPTRYRPVTGHAHFAGMLLLLLALTGYNWYSFHLANLPGAAHASDPGAIARAMTRGLTRSIIVEWILLLYAWVGVRRYGGSMRDLTGGRWQNWKQLGLDVLIAAGFWCFWSASAEVVWLIIGRSHARAGGALHFPPTGALNIALWFGLCISAGFCEEVVYRGYLQKQIEALSNSALVAVLAQGLVFGVSHIYQGYKPVIVISVLGIEYGLLAWNRRNLRSAMLSHAWSDMVAGYLKFLWGW